MVFSNGGVVVYQYTEAQPHRSTTMQTQTAPAQTAPNAAYVRPFGVGYGRSSGYGTPRSYSQSSVPSRFRVA
jgi:hypothetical protein